MVGVLQRFHVVALSAVVVPCILVPVYLMASFLDVGAAERTLFHLACSFSFVWAVLAMIGWIVEKKFQSGWGGWFLGLVLIIEAGTAISFRLLLKF